MTSTDQGTSIKYVKIDYISVLVFQVRVVLYENGNEVASMKFNASGTNRVNWFSQKNLVSSPWNDLKSASNFARFDITGSASRFFEIILPYVGCKYDSGWMVITGVVCKWERRYTKPGILYSKLGSAVNWEVDGKKMQSQIKKCR